MMGLEMQTLNNIEFWGPIVGLLGSLKRLIRMFLKAVIFYVASIIRLIRTRRSSHRTMN